MGNRQGPLRAIGSVCAIGIVAGGCAAGRLDTEWLSPAHTTRNLHAETVAATCETVDEALRRVCEDHWAAMLEARGVKVVRGYQLAQDAAVLAHPDKVIELAKRNGASSIVSTRLGVASDAPAPSGPQVGVGIGGGFGGGGISFGGIGISLPIGGSAPVLRYAVSTSLIEVGPNALIWSGTATTSGSGDSREKIAELTEIIVRAMERRGFLQVR